MGGATGGTTRALHRLVQLPTQTYSTLLGPPPARQAASHEPAYAERAPAQPNGMAATGQVSSIAVRTGNIASAPGRVSV